MWTLVRRRVVDAVLVVWTVGTLSFVLMHMAPGDPVAAAMSDPRVPPAVRAHWRAVYALDRPLAEQYGRYVNALAHAELGYSFSQHRPVYDALRDAMPNSLLLIGLALAASGVLGMLLGAWQAVHAGSWIERVLAYTTSGLSAVPEVWLGLMLLTVFGAQLALFPLNGICDPLTCNTLVGARAMIDLLHHVALPSLTLMLLLMAGVARVQRVAFAEVLHDDVMRTALAKGVSPVRMLWTHAMPRAMRPLLTTLGLMLPVLVGGAVFVERVFGWPGMGSLLVDAIGARDYPLVTAVAISGSLLVLAGSVLTDVAAVSLDPRLRERRT